MIQLMQLQNTQKTYQMKDVDRVNISNKYFHISFFFENVKYCFKTLLVIKVAKTEILWESLFSIVTVLMLQEK